MSRVNPCKGCEERTPECHASCKKYLDWSEERAKERAKNKYSRNTRSDATHKKQWRDLYKYKRGT